MHCGRVHQLNVVHFVKSQRQHHCFYGSNASGQQLRRVYVVMVTVLNPDWMNLFRELWPAEVSVPTQRAKKIFLQLLTQNTTSPVNTFQRACFYGNHALGVISLCKHKIMVLYTSFCVVASLQHISSVLRSCDS